VAAPPGAGAAAAGAAAPAALSAGFVDVSPRARQIVAARGAS
jgi:hypothetical protein